MSFCGLRRITYNSEKMVSLVFIEQLGFYELVYFYDLHRFYMAGIC